VTAGEVLPDLSACRELASALRAGDDSAAAGLAARTGIPRWLLTHPELGPRGRLDAGDAGEALGCISVLAAGRAVDLVRPDHLRYRLLHNGIDVTLTRALRTRTDVIQTRVTIPLESKDDGAGPRRRRARRTKPDKATGPSQSRT
jgi:hypothetical protein